MDDVLQDERKRGGGGGGGGGLGGEKVVNLDEWRRKTRCGDNDQGRSRKKQASK